MNVTLVQVMAWCRQATSHYLSQCWQRSLLPYDVTIDHNELTHCGLNKMAAILQIIVLGIRFEIQDRSPVFHFNWLIGSDRRIGMWPISWPISSHIPSSEYFWSFIWILISSELLHIHISETSDYDSFCYVSRVLGSQIQASDIKFMCHRVPHMSKIWKY